MSDRRRESLILLGTSVRAAAQSAARSGFEVHAADRFGDADLAACADSVRIVSDWPDGLLDIADELPDAPWLFTGGLENRPDLVARLSQRRKLLGCGAAALRIVRDPFTLFRILREAGLPALEVRRPGASAAELQASAPPAAASGISSSGCWIQKPLRSGGGIAVRRFDPALDGAASMADAARTADTFLQARAEGSPVSGLFLSDGSSTRLLGLTRQLAGESQAGADPDGFLYCGSVGPLSGSIPAATHSQAEAIGRTVASAAGLRGLFGIDWIADRDGRLWTLEVNPRWTASAELLQRAWGWPLIRWHVDACLGRDSSASVILAERARPERLCGKVIVYAPAPSGCRVRNLPALVEELSQGAAEAADIPLPGSLIEPGAPVCTLLGDLPVDDPNGRTLLDLAARLRSRLTAPAE